jgi:hypothetical protein
MTVMMSICTGLPQLLTCLDVEKRQGEKNGCEEKHEQILHVRISHFQPPQCRTACDQNKDPLFRESLVQVPFEYRGVFLKNA